MNRKTRAREKEFTYDKKEAELRTERAVKIEFENESGATLLERYLDFMRHQHRHLKLRFPGRYPSLSHLHPCEDEKQNVSQRRKS